MDPKPEEELEREIKKEKEEKGKYRINPENLLTVLEDNLDIADKDLAQLAAEILNVRIGEARNILRERRAKGTIKKMTEKFTK